MMSEIERKKPCITDFGPCHTEIQEIEVLRQQVVTAFDLDEVPQFRQGVPTHELEEVVTAERCAWFVGELITLRKRVKELEAIVVGCNKQRDKTDAELAALRQSQGEPVGIIETLSNRERRCGPVIWIGGVADINALPNGTKLYTSAPTIPEGWQLVRSTITPEVSLRMDELRDADTTNEYLYEVIIAAAAAAAAAAHKTEGMQLVSDARLKELEEYEFMYKSVSK